MGKINHPGRNLSLCKSLILYVVFFVMLALALSIMTNSICTNAADKIRFAYPTSGEKYYLTNEHGEQLGEGIYIGSELTPLSEHDTQAIALLEIVPLIAPPVYSALCIIAAALLFYRNKLKKPLAKLMAASNKISNNDLDFSIEYNSKDELGQLCTSFEIMRTTLANNFSEMWRQVEERKQLNAAFAHDLRTPLTVLKGYNEMLQTSEHNETREIASTVRKHISRMEAYVNSMSTLRRMEDAQPHYQLVTLQPFLSSLYESAKIISTQNEKKLILENIVSVLQLLLDTSFITQVCNNLISNALRYAQTTVTLTFISQGTYLVVRVSDDGKGFDKNSLQNATTPYFTEETNHSEHFGLGLYICKLLCEHHGGGLKIKNTSNGAIVSAYFNSPTL